MDVCFETLPAVEPIAELWTLGACDWAEGGRTSLKSGARCLAFRDTAAYAVDVVRHDAFSLDPTTPVPGSRLRSFLDSHLPFLPLGLPSALRLSMTRVYIYSAALVAFVGAITMTMVAIAEPRWISYSVTTPAGKTFEKHIGLARSCSTLDEACRPYPYRELCQDGERYFCSLWRTVSFAASFAVILSLANLVTFAVIMSGGKYKRETGWPVVSAMLGMVGVLQFVIIGIVGYLYDHDDQFTLPGWRLDICWYLGTVSAAVCLMAAVGMVLSAYLLPPEEGYELLEDPAA